MHNLRMTSVQVLSVASALLLALPFALQAAGPAAADVALPSEPAHTVTWTGAGGDGRWSNALNWDTGNVPRAIDSVRFAAQFPADAVVDGEFAGAVAGAVLDQGYAGTVRLARALTIGGDLRLRSGTLDGGSSALSVAGDTSVSGGLLATPGGHMSVRTLDIRAPGIVRLGANGKLDLAGDGTPLTGDGLLDTTTHAPNSVEYIGHATSDLTVAGPAQAYHGLPPRPAGGAALTSPQGPLTPGAFAEVATIELNRGERELHSAVIDSAAGFGYFGSAAGVVIKVRLSDLSRVAALTPVPVGYDLRTAVIDPSNGYAYFGTFTAPGQVVKVRLSDFTLSAVLTLNAGEDLLASSVIDLAGGFAYFGTGTTCWAYGCPDPPAEVVKIRLTDFTRVGALTLDADEIGTSSAAIDTIHGYAYFGTDTNPGKVVKIGLSDFTRAGTLNLGTDEASPRAAAIDASGSAAVFGTSCPSVWSCPATTTLALKVDLLTFTRAATLTTTSADGNIRSAVIDSANGYVYLGAYTGATLLMKVRLSDFTQVDAIDLGSAGAAVSAVLDGSNGLAYFGTAFGDTLPGSVVKISLPDFTRVATLTMETREESPHSAVIDTMHGFAYFSATSQGYAGIAVPAKVIKVRLSDFTRVGTLTLAPGDGGPQAGVIDVDHDFAYFGGGTTIVKVRLSDFTRVGALQLNPGEQQIEAGVIDPAHGFAYWGAAALGVYNGVIVKVDLSDFSRAGTLTATSSFRAAVIDPANGFAYFGMVTDPGRVIKVRLSDFTAESTLSLSVGFLRAAAIDDVNGFAYFSGIGGYGVNHSGISKVRLSDFSEVGAIGAYGDCAVIDTVNGYLYLGTYEGQNAAGIIRRVHLSDFVLVDSLPLGPGEGQPATAVIDSAVGFAYFATNTTVGIIVKVSLNVGIGGLTIKGPNNGVVGTSYHYTATVSPLAATQPITYAWQVGEQLPVTHTVNSARDAADYVWTDGGARVITVTATNWAGSNSATYALTIKNPLPTLDEISPSSGLAAGPAFTLTVTGTNFVPSSIVRWNGADHATTYVGGTQLQALITPADMAGGGTVAVTVFNPLPGGGESSTLLFALRSILRLPLLLR